MHVSSFSHDDVDYGLNFLSQMRLHFPKPICDVINSFGPIDTNIGHIKLENSKALIKQHLAYTFSFQ